MPARTSARTRARSRAAALTTVTAAGCALVGLTGLTLVASTGAGASSPPTTTASALAGAMARNRQAAVAEARRLLLLAPLPPGSARAASAPKVLSGGGPILGTPAVSSLVVQTQYWRAPMSFDQVQTWLKSHPPVGLQPAGSSSGGGPSAADDTVGYGYSAPATAQLQSAELAIGVASLGPSSSAIRTDAVVIWTDPQPWPDNAVGERTHVTVAAGCPARIAGVVGVNNPGADLTASLLPAGTPTAALVCRYDGADGPAGALPPSQVGTLAHQARLSAMGAGELARIVWAAPISRTAVPGTGLTFHPDACPMDDGAVAVLAFSYLGRADVDLWARLSGCTPVGNGYILGAGWAIAARVKLYG